MISSWVLLLQLPIISTKHREGERWDVQLPIWKLTGKSIKQNREYYRDLKRFS